MTDHDGGECTAGQLRMRMVQQIIDSGSARTEPVIAALRAVPRHAFLPGVPLSEAYNPRIAVITKKAEDGTHLSCASVATLVSCGGHFVLLAFCVWLVIPLFIGGLHSGHDNGPGRAPSAGGHPAENRRAPLRLPLGRRRARDQGEVTPPRIGGLHCGDTVGEALDALPE